jgi:hypothetical protein
MNLHGLVRGVITTVNPDTPATLMQSNGYATSADGSRTPAYTSSTQLVQVQALSAREIQHLDGLNITGVLRKVFLNGDWRSVYRPGNQGGDKIQFGMAAPVPINLRGTKWLVVQVLETWPDWCSLAIQLQMS